MKLLPGTTIETTDPKQAEHLLGPMFLAGGLVLSQVASLTGLEPYVIQNWVKRGFVSPPVQKRYSRRQFCRIAIINMLKDSLQLEKICSLLSYINGRLNDESDDLIEDDGLYFYMAAAVALLGDKTQPGDVHRCCEEALKDYQPPYPGAKKQVLTALEVMVTAYGAATVRRRAENLLMKLG